MCIHLPMWTVSPKKPGQPACAGGYPDAEALTA